MARSVRIRNNTIGGFPICHRSLCGRLLHPFFHHALEILFGNYPYTELRGLGQFRRPHVVAREQIIRIFRDGREVAPAVRLYQRFQLIPAVTAERAGNNDMQLRQRIGEPLLFVGCELHAGGPQPLDDT